MIDKLLIEYKLYCYREGLSEVNFKNLKKFIEEVKKFEFKTINY